MVPDLIRCFPQRGSHSQVIEGWFELRFQESLLLTSVQRYQQHCELREETLTEEEASRKKKDLWRTWSDLGLTMPGE